MLPLPIQPEYEFKKLNTYYYLIVYNYYTNIEQPVKARGMADLCFNYIVTNDALYSKIDGRHIMINERYCNKLSLELLVIDVEKGHISRQNYELIQKIVENKELEKIKVFS